MVNLEDLKQLFLKYKKDRNPDDFADIIVNVDYLIVHFIKVCRKRLGYLRGIESQDLYQDSIIGLHKAIITFPASMKEEYIPCRLKAYMISEFKQMYRYIDKENVELESGEYDGNGSDNLDVDLIDYDLILQSLSKEETELVDAFYSKRKQVQQLAKERNVTSPCISDKIKGIVGRFKKDRLI